MEISSCLIVKNAQDHIEYLITQLSEFSKEICISDTGSSDNTVQIIKSIQEKYLNKLDTSPAPVIKLIETTWEYDFSKARNQVFEMASSDWIFWCDSDDELNSDLILHLKSIEDTPTHNAYQVRYEFIEGYEIPRVALIKASSFSHWIEPVHEYILMSEDMKLGTLCGKLLHTHRTGGHYERNLDIYLRSMQRDDYDLDLRSKLHYAAELSDNGFDEKAYQIYLSLQDQLYDDILFTVLRKMVQCVISKSLDPTPLLDLIELRTDRGDIMYLAGVISESLDIDRAMRYYQRALNYQIRGDEVEFFKEQSTLYPALQLTVLHYNRGEYEKASHYHDLCMKFDPTHPSVINNNQIFHNE